MPQITAGEMNDRRIGILDQIQRLRQGAHGLQVVQHLEHEYNNTVQKIYRDTRGFRDITEVFPPEIWIHIIEESLPTDHYASALLLLTMVSTRWQQVITSNPLFWTHIEISGFDEDSLAMVYTFAYLSHGSPLHLTINLPFFHDPNVANSIMASLGDRVYQVAVRIDQRATDIFSHHNTSSDPNTRQGINFLLQLRQYSANVVYIDLGCNGFGPLTHERVAPEMGASIPSPQPRAVRGFCFCQTRSEVSWVPLQHLTEITTCVPFELLEPNLAYMHNLRGLCMAQSNLLPSSETKSTKPCPALPSLTRVSFMQERASLPTRLLDVVAPQLLELDIHTAEERIEDLLVHLEAATRLTSLSLTLNDRWCNMYSYGYAIRGMGEVRIRSLKRLAISFKAHHIPTARFKVIRQLQALDLISGAYRDVEDVVFYFGYAQNLITETLMYLSLLENLKRLKLDGIGWFIPDGTSRARKYRFNSLKSLEIFASGLVGAIRAPQLLTLTLPWDDDYEVEGILDYPNVRTLHVKGSDDSSRRINIPTGGMPSITSLTLNVPGCDSLKFGLSLFLTEITIIGKPDTSIATSLCFTILYQSEECPSLHNIRLLGCAPEWDVLFTMLESRNFMASSSVSRIRRITLPRVPYQLRGPLASLLRGLYTKRPKNEDLSFKGMIEMLFDKNIPGCRTCLKCMLVSCDEPTTNMDDMSKLEDLAYAVYSTAYDPPPPDLDPNTLEWIYWRERDIESWVAAVFNFGAACWRKAICTRRERNTPVEITEHNPF